MVSTFDRQKTPNGMSAAAHYEHDVGSSPTLVAGIQSSKGGGGTPATPGRPSSSTTVQAAAVESDRRLKLMMDAGFMDPAMAEDLGFQWTPTVRLKVPKPARQNPPTEHTPNGRAATINDENSNELFQRDSNNLIYFNDGRRRIDYVLVYDQGIKDNHHDGNNGVSVSASSGSVQRRRRTLAEKTKLRQFFQENLRRDGLQLEEDILTHSSTENREVTVFVKIHGTWPALCRQAELLKISMPLRLRDTFTDQQEQDAASVQQVTRNRSMASRIVRSLGAFYKRLTHRGLPPAEEEHIRMNNTNNGEAGGGASSSPGDILESYKFVTWPFQSNKIDKYAIADQDTFFSPTQRMEMVWEILQNARNDPSDEKKRGIEQLLESDVYDSAFPIHDGPATVRRSTPIADWCERQVLRETWANWRCLFDGQPLSLIRRYYGEKVGFYFAFLGFYTKMLAIPGVVGLCTFFYGIGYAGDDDLVKDVCDNTRDPGNRTMCPICQPPNCEFTELSEACGNTAWDYRMDNESTLIMAAVTVIWATVFMKGWKRRESELAFEWDTYDVQQVEGTIRPDYEERAPSTRRNPVTKELEPYVPWSRRYWWLLWSICTTLCMLCAVCGALALLVSARVALYGVFRQMGIGKSVEVARWFVHLLIFIMVVIFDTVYDWLGRKVTSMECPRTQAQWLSSFLWKLFIFELLNDFVPIGYAAWVKGSAIRTPLDLTWSSELCDSGGCMGEVTELIAVLLLARLVVGNSMEIGVPFMKHIFVKYVSQRKARGEASTASSSGVDDHGDGTHKHQKCQWRSDRLLNELELDGVADEYMEMIVQFAFVTLFVPAFPLAPFLCLFNNILEIRVDAIKFIVSHRRPLPTRVPGIQIWNEFLNIVGKLAILCNGALMSFTSGMIPRLYYKYFVPNDGRNYDGFVEFSLTSIPTEAWHRRNMSHAYEEAHLHNITKCYYQHYRKESEDFDLTDNWWKIMCARLGFFCVFIAFGYTFQFFYDFLVTDVPASVTLKMQRRRYVVTKAMEADLVTERWFKNLAHQRGVSISSSHGSETRQQDRAAAVDHAIDDRSPSPEPDGAFHKVLRIPTERTDERYEVESLDGCSSPRLENGRRRSTKKGAKQENIAKRSDTLISSSTIMA